jgi:hypothetical protein
MISEVRAYLKSSIRAIDPRLKANKSAFYDGDIGEKIIDKSYQIELNNIVLNSRSGHKEDEFDAVISIFGKGYRTETENYDDLLDKSICIRDYIIEIKNFTGVANIINIVANGVSASQLQNDENAFKIDINLTIIQAYTTGV